MIFNQTRENRTLWRSLGHFFKNSLLVGLISFTTQNAVASFPDKDVIFYGEPSFGLAMGDVSSPGNSENGILPFVGMNIGWQVDYVHILFNGKIGRYFGDELDDGNYRDFGFGVAWEWNLPLITTFLFKFGGNTDIGGTSISGGSGIELNLGYFMSESLKLNLVYSSMTFESGVGSTSADIDVDYFGVSLSLPFVFGYPSEWWRKHL